MDNFFALLIVLSFLGLMVGLVKPSLSLFWSKENITRKNSSIIYGVILIISFILFGLVTDSTKLNEASLKNNIQESKKSNNVNKTEKEDLPDFLNAEKIKEGLSKPPFNFSYWKQSKFNDTNYTYRGYKDENSTDNSKYDMVQIQFDPTTSEIFYSGLYAETDKLDVTPSDVSKIAKFAGFFNPEAEAYLKTNFDNIYLNEKTYLDSSQFSFDDKILFSVTHDFITAKQIIKRDGPGSIKNPLNISIEIENMHKKISLK